MRGLYVHIPFCSGKCSYCGFVSFAGKTPLHAGYLTALEREMALFSGMDADTLYIGGGTPSEFSPELIGALLNHITRGFKPIGDFAESTFEANPESITRSKMAVLKLHGINRVSLGLQTFSRRLLEKIGRRHTEEQFLDAYIDLRSAGFDNINIDVLAAVPDQTADDFAETLSRVCELKPEHISVYGLAVEEDTALAAQGYAEDDDRCLLMLDMARERLCRAGYNHYEISNFAKPGKESLHNINYWDNGEYIGLGCAATSYIGGVRKTNTPSLELYCGSLLGSRDLTLSSCERLLGKEKTGEDLMLGLRKLSGVPITAEMSRHFGDELKKLEARGLLSLSGGKVRLTDEAVYISNEVFRSFVPPFE